MRYCYFILIIVFLAACSAEKKANKGFRLGKYQNTIDFYKKQLARNPNDGRANYFIAESYRLSNRIKESEPYYAKAGGAGLDKDSILFFLAQAQETNRK